MTRHPPELAQDLVSVLLPRKTRDSVIGDLREEYRGTQVPARGEAGANAWYWRQLAGFVLDASLLPGVLLGLMLIGRMLLDGLVPLDDLAGRAQVSTLTVVAVFALQGLRLGRRTGGVAAAVVMAVAASAIGCALGMATALGALAIAAVAGPGAVFQAALVEALDIPLPIITMVGIFAASIGAAVGVLSYRIVRVTGV
jgi:hypothetical protein